MRPPDDWHERNCGIGARRCIGRHLHKWGKCPWCDKQPDVRETDEKLSGIDPVVVARREEIATSRWCSRPCACYRNPEEGDCMSDAVHWAARQKALAE